MSSSLLHPPAHLSPAVALELSQSAPAVLRNVPSTNGTYSISSLWTAAETPELWITYEHLMLSCLRTGDEESAHLCLKRLTQRFGDDNTRLMALRGLFQEAVAKDDSALKQVLDEYESILTDDPSNIPVAKRRIALLQSLNKPTEAITALTKLVDASPTDAEAWAELSDLYVSQANAWNMHARLGEVLYMAATANDSGSEKYLAESFRRFCRSIELCDDYLRGYYGLKLVTDRLIETAPQASRQSKGDTGLPPPEIETVKRLNEVATAKLSEIVRKSAGGEAGWQGYDEAEVIAAKELLNRDAANITR